MVKGRELSESERVARKCLHLTGLSHAKFDGKLNVASLQHLEFLKNLNEQALWIKGEIVAAQKILSKREGRAVCIVARQRDFSSLGEV